MGAPLLGLPKTIYYLVSPNGMPVLAAGGIA